MSLRGSLENIAHSYLRVQDRQAGLQPRRSARLNTNISAATTPTKTTSLRAFAARYKVNHVALWRAVKAIQRPDVSPPQGRPSYLTDDEDDALVAYIQYLQRTDVPATIEQVRQIAGQLAARRDASISPPSDSWGRNWRASHPQVSSRMTKNVERARKAFEICDPEHIVNFFAKLKEVTDTYDIGSSEAWNEDEAGIRIGCLYQKYHAVITFASRHSRPRISDPANRESCTLVGCGNAAGDDIPPWLVFKVWPSTDFAHSEVPNGTRFARSDTGFSNAEISLDWLKHFNKYSWAKSAKATHAGKSLVEWFGLDEAGHNERGMPAAADEYVIRPANELIYRMLVIDGFAGHTTLDFIEYCIRYDIILAVFPPHSTHLLQPLDLAVFQPMKTAHQRSIRNNLSLGEIRYSRADFLAAFDEIYGKGFTAHHLISGFEKSGLFPPDPRPVLATLAKERDRHEAIIASGYESLLPRDDRFKTAGAGLQHIINKYSPLLSPPSHRMLHDVIRPAITEGGVLQDRINTFIRDKRRRSEAYTKQRKKGPLCRPAGVFVTSTSIEEIRDRYDEVTETQRKKIHQDELKMHIRQLKAQEKEFWNQYKAEKFQVIDGKSRRLTIKQWLDHTHRHLEIEHLLETIADYKRQLEGKPDPFYLDFGAPINQEKVDRSRTRTNIISQMSEGCFPTSPTSSINITLGPAGSTAADEAEDEEGAHSDGDSIVCSQATVLTVSSPSSESLPSSPPLG